ncbi:hypothetical protein SAMN02799630_00237 [Paenibacillus sp. UNCCL117]|nr:hypothetical protein SAMN02799630_00237 [Paenibacillus sp. UNCCL117]
MGVERLLHASYPQVLRHPASPDPPASHYYCQFEVTAMLRTLKKAMRKRKRSALCPHKPTKPYVSINFPGIPHQALGGESRTV